MLAALYAPDFARALTGPRDTEMIVIAVTGDDAAVHFRATQSGGRPRDIIDTMTFNERGADHRHACLRHLTARRTAQARGTR